MPVKYLAENIDLEDLKKLAMGVKYPLQHPEETIFLFNARCRYPDNKKQ